MNITKVVSWDAINTASITNPTGLPSLTTSVIPAIVNTNNDTPDMTKNILKIVTILPSPYYYNLSANAAS